ncbi:hypothetical protein [Streptomyces sp. NBC_01334]|uniref:hypothetical protein n=1 Tax=Streptomyces sp. NBC_01334 TaxID=2903827 RepID=UPI002E1635F8|nr:hypothetical protein OG736_02735 [Streptomyces sp. NBC_01334]
MHVVIAWWDGTRGAASGTARTVRSREAGFGPGTAVSLAGEYPGLRDGQWIDDPVAGWEGLALIWDCADSADLFLPVISELTFGCAPSHRWAFELDDAPSAPADPGMRPAELELLLRV